MNCQICCIHKGQFATEVQYDSFLSKLRTAVELGKLELMEEINNSLPIVSKRYFCHECGRKWVLHVPDQSYRGGWEGGNP